jgi:hypothetical protein
MRGLRVKGRGLLGAALAVIASATLTQSGVSGLEQTLSGQDPLKPSSLGHFISDTLALLRPYSLTLLLAVALFFCLLMARELLVELFRSTLRRILNLPDDEPLEFMELTFPADTSKAGFATHQLYRLLNSENEEGSWLERLAMRPKRYSLELVATRHKGIRFIMAVPQSEALAIHHGLLAYLPGLHIRQTSDYLQLPARSKLRLTELRLTNDWAMPLATQGEQHRHDPVAYLAAQMDDLEDDELVAYQIVLSPLGPTSHQSLLTRRDQLQDKILSGFAVTPSLRRPLDAPKWLRVTSWVLEGLLSITSRVFLGRSPDARDDYSGLPKPLPIFEQQRATEVLKKLNDGLFAASTRILVASPTRRTSTARMHAVLSTFNLYSTASQGLAPTRAKRAISKDKLPATAFAKRIHSAPLVKPQVVLSACELVDMYHFPDTSVSGMPQFLKSRHTELPMPLSFRLAMGDSDALYGVSYYTGRDLPIKIPSAQRAKHTYIFGRTGTGKTTLMTRAIYDDILSHRGVAVLDPHVDMFHDLLETIPDYMHDRIVVFDPTERDWPVGLNLLDPGINFSDDIEKRDRITSAVIGVFERLAGDFWGPRMENTLRYVTLTAMTLPEPSLYTIQRLLTERAYQEEVAPTLTDPVFRQFWQNEMEMTGDMQLVKSVAPLTARLGQFINTGMGRRILLQPRSTFSVSDIMDEGKILLVNLSKGELGEDMSGFFGTIITSLIWMAALARADVAGPDRRPFSVYVDEFQNFAVSNFSDIVSEGRKYGIALTLAHQSVAQITDSKVLKVIAGNVGTIISFAGSPDDEAFLQPFMAPVVGPGDIVNLPPHHFFIKAKDIPGADAFTGRTSPKEYFPATFSKDRAARLVALSNHSYGTSLTEIDEYLAKILVTSEPKSKTARPTKPAKGRNIESNPSVSVPATAGPVPGYNLGELQKQYPPADTKNKGN